MRHSRILIATILFGSCLSVALMPTTTTARDYFDSTRGFQFRPGPGTECSSFMMTEMSMLYRVGRADSKLSIYDQTPSRSNSYMFNWQVGYMTNTSKHDSWGGAFNVALGDERYRIGAGPAYRRWLRGRSFIDASAGILLSAKEDGFYAQETPLYAQLGIGVSGIFSIVGKIEHISFKDTRVYAWQGWGSSRWSSTFFHLGVYVGGEPGAVLCSISAAVIFVAAVLLHNNSRVSSDPIPF